MRQRDDAPRDRSAGRALPPELEQSYTRAVYRVDFARAPLFLRIGVHDPALDREVAALGGAQFAFLSAANPGSVPLAEDENVARLLRLEARVRELGLRAVGGESYDAGTGGWHEASLLICGLGRAEARALAREFGQLALLWGSEGAAVELLVADDLGDDGGS
jgi:hypothetical protein